MEKEMDKWADPKDPWDSRELGSSLEEAQVVDPAKMQEVDSAIGMKPISLRLPAELIQAYKLIAAHHGVGYQPLMRDILQRFVKEGLREVVESQTKKSEAAGERVDNAIKKVA